MPRVVWSRPALGDIVRLHAFLAPKDRDAARRAAGAIRQGVRLLARHPKVGRSVDDMQPEFRELFVRFGQSGYVVRYRYDGREVVVLAVRHGKEAGYWSGSL